MALEGTVVYDSLIAGSFPVVTEAILIDQSQTIKRGDVLKKVAGKYQRPTAVVVEADDIVIASEDITTGAGVNTASVGYRSGEFNLFAMRFGGSSTAEDNRTILANKAIYIKSTVK
jgi:hypothetical protein